MIESVVSAYRELYHYTTGVGLEAIVRSQKLRATHIRYLNDSEEYVGFFSRRLPKLLFKPVGDAVNERLKDSEVAKLIRDAGGVAPATIRLVEGFVQGIQAAADAFHEPFVTSFCRPPENQAPNDGLLSQWRAYGTDGGYAIVFETAGLEALLNQETTNFHYQLGNWSDVDYDDQGANLLPKHPERIEWEWKLQEAIRRFVLTQKQEELAEVYNLIAYLACRHKHHGFREEMEVRIVAIPTNDEVYKLAYEKGARQPRKQVHFDSRGGVLVPHIFLFGERVGDNVQRLPIKKIIVGPHHEKEKRQRAVERLLRQHQVNADVVASEIPYLGH